MPVCMLRSPRANPHPPWTHTHVQQGSRPTCPHKHTGVLSNTHRSALRAGGWDSLFRILRLFMGEKLLLTEHRPSMGRALLGTRPALSRWLLTDRDRGSESRRPWHGRTGTTCSWSTRHQVRGVLVQLCAGRLREQPLGHHLCQHHHHHY